MDHCGPRGPRRSSVVLVSLSVEGASARVVLRVQRGEFAHTLRRYEDEGAWSVEDIRLSWWVYYYLYDATTQAVQLDSSMGSLGIVDSRLFELVVREIAESTRGELRVDPRPLRADPGVVTLKGVSAVAPEFVGMAAHGTLIMETGDADLQKRRALLRGLRVAETHALRDARCPGIMVPPSNAETERKRRLCPRESYSSAIIALPREGGAYWPGNPDERSRYRSGEEFTIYSVRVVTTGLSPRGSIETSWEYVFERRENRGWRLLETRPLLVVE